MQKRMTDTLIAVLVVLFK